MHQVKDYTDYRENRMIFSLTSSELKNLWYICFIKSVYANGAWRRICILNRKNRWL